MFKEGNSNPETVDAYVEYSFQIEVVEAARPFEQDYAFIYDCDGGCLNDVDEDSVCDEFDDCVGDFDACGICNGPGAVYTCGCAGIPAGDCDCDGNVLDALGVCGGLCLADDDGNGVCDNAEVGGCIVLRHVTMMPQRLRTMVLVITVLVHVHLLLTR